MSVPYVFAEDVSAARDSELSFCTLGLDIDGPKYYVQGNGFSAPACCIAKSRGSVCPKYITVRIVPLHVMAMSTRPPICLRLAFTQKPSIVAPKHRYPQPKQIQKVRPFIP